MSDDFAAPSGAGATTTAREIEILRVALRDSNAERATLRALLARAGSTLPMGFRRSLEIASAPKHPRVAILERVRARLNEANERLLRERDEARASAAASAAQLDERRSAEDELASRYAEACDLAQRLQEALARADSRVRELCAHGELAAERIARLQQNALELERHVSSASHALERNAALVRSFEDAHVRAAESIATLERERRYLEFDLAERLTLAQNKAVEQTLAVRRLVAERALLAETLALRERRIANVETALREMTVDFVRATEAELQRYAAALASVEASPIGRIRSWVRQALRRPASALPGALRTLVPSPRRRRKRAKPGDRHLRSA